MKNIRTIHLSAPGCSDWCSHFSIIQKTSAVKKEESAYTSPSTALYQKESLKVYARAPTTPAAMTVKICCPVSSPLSLW